MRKPFLEFFSLSSLITLPCQRFAYVASHLMRIETIINTPLGLPLSSPTCNQRCAALTNHLLRLLFFKPHQHGVKKRAEQRFTAMVHAVVPSTNMFNQHLREGSHDDWWLSKQLLHAKEPKVTSSSPLCLCSIFQGGWVPKPQDCHRCLSFWSSLHRLLMSWPALQDLFRGFLEPPGFCWACRPPGIGTRCSLAKAGKPAAGFLYTVNDALEATVWENL